MSVTTDGKEGKKHGSWQYGYNAEEDRDWWCITWHWNWNGDNTNVKTQTFHEVTDASCWFHKARDTTYSSVLTVPPQPAADDAGSSASLGAGSSASLGAGSPALS